jgi:ATP-dependent Clp protease protease subunit
MSNSNNEINRNLFLGDVITDTSVKPIIEKIREINQEDDKKTANVVNYDRTRKPIVLTLNTPGGVITAGLALIDVMMTSKTPVHTEALGLIASMGVPIFISGQKRYTHEHTVFMLHDGSYGQGGTVEEHERRLEVLKRLYRDRINNLLLSRTYIRREDIEEYQSNVRDWYFDSDEAIKLGVANYKIKMTRLSVDDVKSGNFVVED